MAVHTLQDLKQMQALPLSVKIRMTEQRIRDWVREWGEDGVYVAFSGGKDSTVLLDIVRNRMGYTQIPAVYVDTGLEYPEIRDFIKTFENVVWLKPEMNFKQVIEKYGYPFISKEVAQAAYECNLRIKKGEKPPEYRMVRFNGEYKDKTGKKSQFNMSRWKFLVGGKFDVSHRCCLVMKKNPSHRYWKKEGRCAITAEMASESKLRTQWWLKYGCNGFDLKIPKSMPMSFWTEQDVLLYISSYNIPICSVYGDIVPDYGEEELDRQMDLSDFGLMENRRKLKTTGCERTGCMFCGFGCHREKDGEGKFEKMKLTHPKLYDYIMRPKEQGGLNYKEVIDWINEHGNMNIRY